MVTDALENELLTEMTLQTRNSRSGSVEIKHLLLSAQAAACKGLVRNRRQNASPRSSPPDRHGAERMTKLAKNMKKRTKQVLAFVAGITLVSGCLFWYAMSSISSANDLGLTPFDLAMGGQPDVEALRASTKNVAEAYLSRRHEDLAQTCGGPFSLAVNYNLSQRARTLGYRSSFYYFCWDIYLPYLLKTDSGENYLVLVQLSDRTPGNKHDLKDLRVLRVLVIDGANQVKVQFDE